MVLRNVEQYPRSAVDRGVAGLLLRFFRLLQLVDFPLYAAGIRRDAFFVRVHGAVVHQAFLRQVLEGVDVPVENHREEIRVARVRLMPGKFLLHRDIVYTSFASLLLISSPPALKRGGYPATITLACGPAVAQTCVYKSRSLVCMLP